MLVIVSRCLIYKVHAAASRAAYLSYQILFPLSSAYLLPFEENFSFACLRWSGSDILTAASRGDLFILFLWTAFVNSLWTEFSNRKWNTSTLQFCIQIWKRPVSRFYEFHLPLLPCHTGDLLSCSPGFSAFPCTLPGRCPSFYLLRISLWICFRLTPAVHAVWTPVWKFVLEYRYTMWYDRYMILFRPQRSDCPCQ